MEINWEKQAKRNFDPVKIWNNAMDKIATEEKILIELQDNFVQRKSTATLLAKNPNHFRDLAIKSNAKRREKN